MSALELDPDLAHAEYRSTELRAPKRAPLLVPMGEVEKTGPLYGPTDVDPSEADLTRQAHGEPLGERIIVTGRVLNGDGTPVPNVLVEIWQANAAGRYAHQGDQHPAPLDANFHGAGRCVTDARGEYRFVSIKPGAYPWRNHHNAWRPAHIHFSLFGRNFTERLITQMYFPGDPLFALDPIFNSVPAEGRDLMVSTLDIEVTEPEWALGYRWDIVLRGQRATPMER